MSPDPRALQWIMIQMDHIWVTSQRVSRGLLLARPALLLAAACGHLASWPLTLLRYLWPPHTAAATCGRLTPWPLLVAASHRGRYFWPPGSEATFTTAAWPPSTAIADRLAT
jgi:hypothetical protein